MIMHKSLCNTRYISTAFLIAASTLLFTWQPAKAAQTIENLCPRPTQPALPAAVPTDWSNFSNPGFITDYTYLGLPIVDMETSKDETNGGAAVQPTTSDLASGSTDENPGMQTTPFYGYYDGGTKYDPDDPSTMMDDFVLFRMRLEDDPKAKSGFGGGHWNVLVDVDDDGYKEFWVDLDGGVSSKAGEPDILQVLYNNDNNQIVPDSDAARVYSFDAFNDGRAGSFTRSYAAPDGVDGDYWLEVQVPLWSFLNITADEATGCVQQVTPDSPVGFVFSTSTSNQDPLQKDWMMDLQWISNADPIVFGDIVTISGEPRIHFADDTLQEVYFYTVGDDVYTFVKHVLANTDSSAIDTVVVTVTNPRTGDDEQITLVESSPASGLFTNRGGADTPDISSSPGAWIPGVTTSATTDNASWSVQYSGGVWQVLKNGVPQAGSVTPGAEYTSPGGEISFTLYQTSPSNGDSIIFDTYAAVALPSIADDGIPNNADNDGFLEAASGDTIQFSYNTGSRNYTTEAAILDADEPFIQFTRASGLPNNEFHLTTTSSSDLLYVTVTHDPTLPVYDIGVADTITVELTGYDNDFGAAGSHTLTLTETGPSTGIFRNTTGLLTQVTTGSPEPNDNTWEDIDLGEITATMTYNSFDYPTTAQMYSVAGGGRVNFTNISGTVLVENYTGNQPVYVRLEDVNFDICGTPPPQVTVTSPSGDSETISVIETPSDSGVYINDPGTLSSAVYDGAFVINDGIIELSHEDTVTVSYTDCNDGDPDPINDIKTDTAIFNSPTILINEVFFYPSIDPLDGQTEFFQVYNSSSGPVNIFGYTVTDEDGFTYTFPMEPQGTFPNEFILDPGQIAYVFLYEQDYSSLNSYDSGTDTFYLFTDGGARPSDQYGDPDDIGDPNRADQLTLRDSSDKIVDYVGWSYVQTPSVDFLGDDSGAVLQSIWQDDAFRIVYDTDPDPLVDTGIKPGSAITRVSAGFDTDKPSDWIYKDVTYLWEEGSPLITQVIIRSFDASLENGQIVLRWETASEIGTLGFYLYRRDKKKFNYELVNEDLLPGLITSPQGGTYTYVDTGADPEKKYEYLLEEVEVNSNRNEYGPYKVKDSEGKHYSTTRTEKTKYSRKARLGPAAANTLDTAQSTRKKNKRSRSDSKRTSKKKKSSSRSEVDALKISVLESGLYMLYADEIADHFSLSDNQLKKRINKGQIKLTNMGRNVAYQPMANNNGIYFYGQKLDSQYSTENIYWLTLDNGSRMSKLKLRKKPRRVTAELSFAKTLHVEEDFIPVLNQPIDTSEDYWIWNFIFSGFEGFDFVTLPFEIEALDTSAGKAKLSLHFIGGSMEGAGDDHHAEVIVNDQLVGDCYWKGIEKHTCNLFIQHSLLEEGRNTLIINGILEGDVGFSLFYVDSFEVNYERYFQARENTLFFPGEDSQALIIKGFNSAEIFVLDVTQPDDPLFTTEKATRNGKSYVLDFMTDKSSGKFLTVAAAATRPADGIQPYSSNSHYLENDMADYILITPAELQETAQILADYRSSQGHDVKVVLFEELIDAFNFGIASPEAIRNYLSFTYEYWRNAPRYVVLIGDGTYDYKDIEGYGGNLMPPLLVSTPTGVFPSDNALADVSGNGVPDMAIGRIPASTPAELQAVIDKIIQYENGTGNWKEKALMLADRQYNDEDDFEFSSNRISRLLPKHYSLDKIHLSDMDLDTARQQLIAGLNSGAAISNFFGHAGLDQLGQEGLLLYTDVDALSSPQGSPVITAMTCAVGQFSFAAFDTLAEMLVVRENGGATAVWSSAGLSENSEARLLDAEFYRALFENDENILGDAILSALNAYAELGSEPYHISIYNLLGDPALRMK